MQKKIFNSVSLPRKCNMLTWEYRALQKTLEMHSSMWHLRSENKDGTNALSIFIKCQQTSLKLDARLHCFVQHATKAAGGLKNDIENTRSGVSVLLVHRKNPEVSLPPLLSFTQSWLPQKPVARQHNKKDQIYTCSRQRRRRFHSDATLYTHSHTRIRAVDSTWSNLDMSSYTALYLNMNKNVSREAGHFNVVMELCDKWNRIKGNNKSNTCNKLRRAIIIILVTNIIIRVTNKR